MTVSVLLLSSALVLGAPPPKAPRAPTTQLELNDVAGAELRAAEKELEVAFKKVLAAAAAEPQLVKRLEAAQRAWVAYRDAQRDALYGDEPFSMKPLCAAAELTRLTKERTAFLRARLEPVEGDACATLHVAGP